MVIDFINRLSARTEISPLPLVGWMELSRSKYYQWKDRYGKANGHSALIPPRRETPRTGRYIRHYNKLATTW